MYDVYIDKMLLPVTPSKIDVKINNKNTTLTLIDDGEINVLKKAGLTDISFAFTLPAVQYPFANYKAGFQPPKAFLDNLEELKKKKQPFQFIVSRIMQNGSSLHSTNIKVSLEDYTLSDDAEEGFDTVVNINLKQYKPYGTRTVEIKQDNTVPPPEPVRETKQVSNSQEYTVVKGDCLWNIAKKYYGDGSKWKKIYEANPGVCGEPYTKGGTTYVLIHPGDKLTIPALE